MKSVYLLRVMLTIQCLGKFPSVDKSISLVYVVGKACNRFVSPRIKSCYPSNLTHSPNAPRTCSLAQTQLHTQGNDLWTWDGCPVIEVALLVSSAALAARSTPQRSTMHPLAPMAVRWSLCYKDCEMVHRCPLHVVAASQESLQNDGTSIRGLAWCDFTQNLAKLGTISWPIPRLKCLLYCSRDRYRKEAFGTISWPKVGFWNHKLA